MMAFVSERKQPGTSHRTFGEFRILSDNGGGTPPPQAVLSSRGHAYPRRCFAIRRNGFRWGVGTDVGIRGLSGPICGR